MIVRIQNNPDHYKCDERISEEYMSSDKKLEGISRAANISFISERSRKACENWTGNER
jgi:hypothetical protein